jgi:hypothetical protein
MNVSELTPDQVEVLEEASDKVRRGEPIDFRMALLVIQYQDAKPKPKPKHWLRRVWEYLN